METVQGNPLFTVTWVAMESEERPFVYAIRCLYVGCVFNVDLPELITMDDPVMVVPCCPHHAEVSGLQHILDHQEINQL